MKRYQVSVARELIGLIEGGHPFIVVSMPTGSGKTFVEMLSAYYAINRGYGRVLVLEPTRFLCDQMFRRLWFRVFGGIVGVDYEGRCDDFLDLRKRIVIATPMTSGKCAMEGAFDFVVVDEVHHAFGDKRYAEVLRSLKPKVVVGFTALLPSDRLSSGLELVELLGGFKLLHYDFKKLKEVDPEFEPPRAIVDIFDSELSGRELEVYDKLLRGGIAGDTHAAKFLERTLVSHGVRAFCESYQRLLESGGVAEDISASLLCGEQGYSHKARVAFEILESYNVGQQHDRLVLVYTGRVQTALELGDVLKQRGLKVEVLTGGVSRDERLKLQERLRNREIAALVSTRVGEEGIDIPEAWLLVMSDVTRNPLRFYQRIGRLIRVGSPDKIKHLVLILTPGTFEYDSLEEVLWRLHEEGVDVSYIIANIDVITGKTTVDHVVKAVKFIQEQAPIPPSIPFLLRGRESIPNIVDMIRELVGLEEVRGILDNTVKQWGITLEDIQPEDLIFVVLTSIFNVGELKRKVLRHVDTLVKTRSTFSKIVNKAIRKGRLAHVYDVDAMADIIAYELSRLHRVCSERFCENMFFRMDSKPILRLVTRVFTMDKLDQVLEETRRSAEATKEELRVIAEEKGLKYDKDLSYSIRCPEWNWNRQQKALICQAYVHLNLKEHSIHLSPFQVNYYDIDLEALGEAGEKVIELFELNLEVALQKAILKFMESLISNG